MAVAYQFGPVYFQALRLKRGAPIFETAPTHEQEEPYRHGRCVVVKYWPRRALAIGWWTGKHESEDSALMAGVQAREDELVDEDGKLLERFKVSQAARQTVADNSADPDEEWEILNALDILADGVEDYPCPDDEEEECTCGADDAADVEILKFGLDEDDER